MSDIQEPANLADMVRARARSRGDATVYEFEGRRTSFAEFDIRTNRVANALRANGVRPRERIAYVGKNSDIYFELLLGAMKANVVMAPVNWRLSGPEIAFIVADCKASVLFVGPEFITQVRNILPQLPHVRTVITTEGGAPEWQGFAAWRDTQSGDDAKVPISRQDIAIQLYTSGTTGKPKGAMLSRPLSRREGRYRQGIQSHKGAGFLRTIRHHEAVHGTGRDAIRGAAAARAPGGFFATEIHALWRPPPSPPRY